MIYFFLILAFVAGLVLGEYCEAYKWRLKAKAFSKEYPPMYSQGVWYAVLPYPEYLRLREREKPSTFRLDDSGIPTVERTEV